MNIGPLSNGSRLFGFIRRSRPLSISVRHCSTSSDAMDVPYTVPLPGGIPLNHKPHTESKTTILLPSAGAFLNPPQQFNRDLSVAVIRAWNERRKELAEAKYKAKAEKGKGKGKKGKKGQGDAEHRAEVTVNPEEMTVNGTGEGSHGQPVAGPSNPKPFRPHKITILEALSATGLRAIRYAKEIPDVKCVLANDLSPSACEAMRMNVAYNGVAEDPLNHPPSKAGPSRTDAAQSQTETEEGSGKTAHGDADSSDKSIDVGRRAGCDGFVRVTEGDACDLMLAHRHPVKRVEVVDLDPYGTAAPFIDAAVNAVADGGLLCVTCTDTAVFAGNAYPEKSFSNYGGTCVNAEYRHEVGLRLILHSVANAAARYGRHITPLLSFSIDFYARLFILITTSPAQVKDLASQTGLVFYCPYCHVNQIQPFGRTIQKENALGQLIKDYKLPQKAIDGDKCVECGTRPNVGGPMWLGPIQDPEFARIVLKGIEGDKEQYGTWTRMHGMLTLAEQELPDPFYFTLNRIASHFHATSPPSSTAINALLHAGYNVSRSHATAGSLKTNAPWSFIYDIMRESIKTNPVRMDNIAEKSQARELLAKAQTHEINLSKHPETYKLDKGQKVVFYQENPTQNWGPASRAKSYQKHHQTKQGLAEHVAEHTTASDAAPAEPGGEKRKAELEDMGEETNVKRAKVGSDEVVPDAES
ncbi:S-adenosyl-L-methionine-dependent methyltransferase [Kockovaella imperatae]|uniref:tRNA (guanine(26)-N(2))-dimethyltransferase n=1 Tax=Kockovaella imperatae TaxID=4999 RepID=A0A1Y1UFQ6_9TREE|nr:S-adenosyl-L-methionine-dependent methyltransferase [Kockovaella imperatae]ORX36858.1 S-adenosyl-L-methionine-dependent methyltransferase [Kockovaella imperatae]